MLALDPGTGVTWSPPHYEGRDDVPVFTIHPMTVRERMNWLRQIEPHYPEPLGLAALEFLTDIVRAKVSAFSVGREAVPVDAIIDHIGADELWGLVAQIFATSTISGDDRKKSPSQLQSNGASSVLNAGRATASMATPAVNGRPSIARTVQAVDATAVVVVESTSTDARGSS